jgi:signal recognition particle subunit SRP54
MFDTLTERLGSIAANLRGKGRLTEDDIARSLREARLALLEADVALPVVKEFLDQVRARALGTEVQASLTPGQALVKIVQDELAAVLTAADAALDLRVTPPAVILLAGLQGAGKTTTAGKLARRLREQDGKRVLLVSTDVYRPAAIDQLERVAREAGAVFLRGTSADPVAIATEALAHAKRQFHDVLLVDTAGRLHVDAELMDEIARLHAALRPAETLFVVDAMSGQDAANSARAFASALPLTGVILTKADGDARGGAALSAARLTGKPVKFLGTGEKLDGLEAFDPQRIAARILGMGDVLGLIEQVQARTDADAARKLAEKVVKGGFDLEDFRDQLRQMLAMGGMGALLDRLPGGAKLAQAAAGQFDERSLRRQAAIVDSMTPRERRRPAIINGSRRRRIALGAGVQVQDVNRLLKQFDQMERVMGQMKGGGLRKLMGRFGGGFRGGGAGPR